MNPTIVRLSDAELASAEREMHKGDIEAMLAWYREMGERSPYFFSKVIAGYAELTVDLHKPVCQWFVDSEEDIQRGILFPRKYFKSSMLKGYMLRALTQPGGTERRWLLVGENEVVGAKNVTDIQYAIRENKLFQALYPHIIPDDKGRDWPTSSLTLPRSKSYDEPTIQSIGIGTKHTGFHYTDIVMDDPIGLVASRSKPEMEKAKDWLGSIPGLLDSILSRQLYVGTRWKHGAADLPGHIMKEMPAGQPGGFKWIVRAAIENGKSIFPPQIASSGKRIGYSLTDLAAMKRQMKTYLFNANMMNNPTAGDDVDFMDSWIGTYRIAEDRKGLILENGERVNLADLVRISVWDPSSGGASAEAENAIVVIGCDWKGRIFVLAIWHKNSGFRRAIEEWHVLNDKWNCSRNYFEAVGAHKEAGDDILQRENPCKMCGKTHRRIRARPILPPPGSKEDRIRDYAQTAFEELRVYLGEGMTELRDQITQFPHGEYVDLLDALAYCIKHARKPRHVDSESGRPKKNEDSGGNRPTNGSFGYTSVDYGGYG